MILAGFACAGRVAAEDPWYDLYQSALKSISSRKWVEAERKLKAAMASGPPSGRQVRMYGVRLIDYLPEYHLGRVYFSEQRYADALEQFAKVQASGLVTKNDAEFQPLTDMVELCRLRTAPSLADGQGEAAALVRFAKELMGRGSLEDARRALDGAAAKDAGSKEVAAAREQLVRLETEQRLGAEQERRAADLAKSPTGPMSAPTTQPASAPPPVRSEPSPTPTSIPVARAESRPGRDLAQERAAYEAFFAGEYVRAAEAFEKLAGVGASSRRDRMLAYAACSRAGLALLSGKPGEDELARARKLFAEAGTAAGRLVARDGFVSPRIVALLTEPASVTRDAR
jgi:tetratricopeptide (TPR) repeat protein